MQQIGAILVPVYPTISEGDYKFIFNDASVKLVFVADWELYTKISNVKPDIPTLQDIYTFNKIEGAKLWKIFSPLATPELQLRVEELKPLSNPEPRHHHLHERTSNLKANDVLHNNIVSNVKAVQPILPVSSKHTSLSFLPLCHIFERVVLITLMLEIHDYAESLETLVDNLRKSNPTSSPAYHVY